MLKTLTIKNFILILDAKIEFSKGLNIITGESGSGKSAILKAIDALLGAKFDANCIYPGKNSATIEAIFELANQVKLKEILKDYDLNQQIILRREISKNNRSRFFINDQLISLGLIKECSIYFADYISQKQAASLSQDKYIRIFVDTLADCNQDVNKLSKLWDCLNQIRKKINDLLDRKNSLEINISLMKEDLALIEKINYVQNEENELEENHLKLIKNQEVKTHFSKICDLLSDDSTSVLFKLRQIEKIFQNLTSFNIKAEKLYQAFKNAFIELNELSFEISQLSSSIEDDPNLLTSCEMRIQELDLLKKRFGQDLSILDEKKNQLLKNIENFDNIDENLEKLKLDCHKLENEIDEICSKISNKRNQTKINLEKKIIEELHSLNLNNASFELLLEKKSRSANGDESPNFLFSANLNTKLQPLQKIASGGELARVMLALKCIILGKDSHHCLIFDEIDANVGGKSAAVIGDKLLKLAQYKQIICVTHFIQVAKKAHAHFLVEKLEKNQKSISIISKLDDAKKDYEYQRMLGNLTL